jgi:hypothetical protein
MPGVMPLLSVRMRDAMNTGSARFVVLSVGLSEIFFCEVL